MRQSLATRAAMLFFTFAAICGVFVGLVILFVPLGSSVSVTSDSPEPVISSLSFFEMQGWWGIWMLVAFAALYYGPLHFYRRGSKAAVVVFTLAAVSLTALAGFSIGAFYMIGGVALLIGLVLMLLSGKISS